MTRTEFFQKVNHQTEITLREIIGFADGDVDKLLRWLNSEAAFDVHGVQLCLSQDTVDNSDPSNHPEAIWDGTLIVDNNAFYWAGADGPGGGRKPIRTRVYRHTVFDVT